MKRTTMTGAAVAVIMLTVAAAFLGCGREESAAGPTGPVVLPDEHIDRIWGHTVNSVTGNEVPYVYIEFYVVLGPGEWDLLGTRTSDEEGYYEFPLQGYAGKFIVILAYKEYYYDFYDGFYYPGGTYWNNIFMVPWPSGDIDKKKR
jgi:hypothetical protein